MYTEQDMQIAMKALEHLLNQYIDAQAVIWALVMQSGGSVKIDQKLLVEMMDKGNKLTTWEDMSDLSFCIKAA